MPVYARVGDQTVTTLERMRRRGIRWLTGIFQLQYQVAILDRWNWFFPEPSHGCRFFEEYPFPRRLHGNSP